MKRALIYAVTVQEKLNETAAVLASNLTLELCINTSYREAELILQHVLSLPREGLYTRKAHLSDEALKEIDRIASERQQGKPLQYLLGETEFFGLTIKVKEGVFIPRPETEYMVECAISSLREMGFRKDSRFRVLDLCTGSGCIALAIGRYFPNAKVVASDISIKALCYARENAALNGVSNVYFLVGDLFDCIRGMPFDLVISNPPYIRTSEIAMLQPEIRDYEPMEALDGGKDGLDFYRRIFGQVGSYVGRRGLLILELGYGQSEAVVQMAKGAGLNKCSVIKDYAGIDRILVVRS